MFQDAFDAAASVSTSREPVRSSVPASRGFNTKLHPYDSTTEALDTFLARFENFSTHYQWNESERLFNLRNCLAKSVGNVLWDSGSISSSFELIQLLRSRYGTEHQSDRFRMELRSRRRQKGESLQDLFQDVKRLMALTFLGQHGSMVEITAIDAFVDSFTDKDLRNKCYRRALLPLQKLLLGQ